MDYDVIVVGAGLAGLRCAAVLHEAGREVVVLEAADHVGGRVSTEVVDGFRCDRGFQVLNPAYPALPRAADVGALGLQQFDAGALVRAGDRLRVLADPVRAPRYLRETLTSGLLDAGDLAGLARWLTPVLVDPQGSISGEDAELWDALDRAGVDGPLRRVLDRFLAGVLADSHGTTSSDFTRLLVRAFVLGRPGLPREGMQALPEQIAAGLPEVRLDSPVRAVRAGAVDTAAGTLSAHDVVVAAGPTAAAGLLDRPIPAVKGLVTWWFEAPESPDDRPLLALDCRHGPDDGPPGPVWNSAVLSAAAPTYAPAGRHLVQATTLLDRPDGDASEGVVLAQLGEIYSCDTSGWQVVTRHWIPEALPASPPPAQLRRPVGVAPGLWVCGDHQDTASIQGALVSGERCAAAILDA
ncbi:oxidoreductase [Arsenicicoccus piscis]|uniref:Oxidoreductase n=1 Tax=Arsenicicoccus piscis TaxID=673954 RepID=A0ABQ6HTJ9_9MICO|nr:oxidoreductase [Arsenicicoccus piscis]